MAEVYKYFRQSKQTTKRDFRRWNLPWLSTRNSVCAVRQTWGEKLLNFLGQKLWPVCDCEITWSCSSNLMTNGQLTTWWQSLLQCRLFVCSFSGNCVSLFEFCSNSLFDLILLLKSHDSVNSNTTTLARIGNTSATGQEESCSIIAHFFWRKSLNVVNLQRGAGECACMQPSEGVQTFENIRIRSGQYLRKRRAWVRPGRIVENRIVSQKIEHPGGKWGETLETTPEIVKQSNHGADCRLLGIFLKPPAIEI